MANCLVAQSGGPTVAINSSLAGVIQGSNRQQKSLTRFTALLMVYRDFLNGCLMDLTEKS